MALSGWTTGNSIALIISHNSGSGVRWVESWGYARDGLATPLLEIEWEYAVPAEQTSVQVVNGPWPGGRKIFARNFR